MTRIRKGHNLLSKGHLQPGFLCGETADSSRVVDNKAIFNSILNRIRSLSYDGPGESVDTFEARRGVVSETWSDEDWCDDDAEDDSTGTAEVGILWNRSGPAQAGAGVDGGVKIELSHGNPPTKKFKSGKVLVTAVPLEAQDADGAEDLVRSDDERDALADRFANESAPNRLHSATTEQISSGGKFKVSDRNPERKRCKLSGNKREFMEDSREPGSIIIETRNMPSSGLEQGNDPVRACKRRSTARTDDTVHEQKHRDRSANSDSEDDPLRWCTSAGLSPHLKRPRTPHLGRMFGFASGGPRMPRKRPRLPDSSAHEIGDSLLERGNEAKGPCLQSPLEKIKDPRPQRSQTAGTAVPERKQTESSPCRTKNEVKLVVEISSVPKVEESHAVNNPEVDDPSKQLPGSLMHSLHLVFFEAGCRGLSAREAMTAMAKKGLLPANGEASISQVLGHILSSPYFIEVEEGRFYLCSALQDMQKAPLPKEVGPHPTDDGLCAIQTECHGAGQEQGLGEVNMGSSGDKDNVQEHLHTRADSVMGEAPLKESMDRSYESDTADRESDEDFEIGDHISGYSSGGTGTTISDSRFAGEEEEQASHQARSTVRRAAGASDRGAVKKTGWRHLVDSVPKEENDSKQGNQCARTDGRRWQCPLRANVGYSLCEHHLNKFRMKKARAVQQRRAMVEKARREAAETDGEDKKHIAFSTHLNSKGQRKTVKNRSLMSMY